MSQQVLQPGRPSASSIERRYPFWIALLCAVSILWVLHANWAMIAGFRFWDADDVMRLLEVRDWLAGQGWADVAQHRMNQPQGLAMHWSRLLDVIPAALILLVQPWAGQRVAETVAVAGVPMMALVASQLLVGAIARRRDGAGAGLLAAGLCLLSIGCHYALLPMRIDHHGWQIVAGLGLVWALVRRPDAVGTVMAGVCAAAWTQISLEGLAFTAGAAAWLGLLWIWQPRYHWRLPLFLGSLAGASIFAYLAAHGVRSIGAYCDQVSPVHCALFLLAAALTSVAAWVRPAHPGWRAVTLAAAGVSCALLYRLWAPGCAAGPFGALGPLGRSLWYLHVPEGIPLWRVGADVRLVWGVFPWVGLAGALYSSVRQRDDRLAHPSYGALLLVATLIAVMVTRVGAFANLLAIPGAVSLMVAAFARTAAWRPTARILARVASLLLLNPAAAQSTALLAIAPSLPMERQRPEGDPGCGQIDRLAPLDRIAPVTIAAPLDMGPAILAGTHHAAITGPYHRNPQALEDVLHIFTAPDAAAVAHRRHAQLLIFCPGEGEMRAMAKFAPTGLAARLVRNDPPSWLQPETVPGTAGLRVYRILP